MIKMIVDTMGSDNGSEATVGGILRFLETHKDVEIIAVGKKEELSRLEGLCEIIDAREVVPMEAGALEVMRLKDSSMLVALKKMKEVNADAIVSAGSTGGFLSAATLILRLIDGVERAALVTAFPTAIKGKKVTILDIGASNENTASQLVQFAKMGKIYSQSVYGTNYPNIYLLSNGAEDGKGSPESKEALKILRNMNMEGFKGNIEARYALSGDADVIVTGGFAGNIFLKGTEGVAGLMNGLIKKAFKRNVFSKIGYLLAKKGFKEMKETMDYKSVGGAMLLGVNGVVVKGHGSSDAYSFFSAMNVAYKMAEQKVVEKMKEGFKVNE